jgi:hypothetical protein
MSDSCCRNPIGFIKKNCGELSSLVDNTDAILDAAGNGPLQLLTQEQIETIARDYITSNPQEFPDNINAISGSFDPNTGIATINLSDGNFFTVSQWPVSITPVEVPDVSGGAQAAVQAAAIGKAPGTVLWHGGTEDKPDHAWLVSKDSTTSKVKDPCYKDTGAIYITSIEQSIDGDGGPNCPFDGSTADKLRAILEANTGEADFVYYSGVYETYGWQNGGSQTIRSNQHHRADVSGGVTLKLVGADDETQNGRIFGADAGNYIQNFSATGFVLDCNAAEQPKFINNTGGTITAVRVIDGEDVLIKDCKVINYGTKGGECFPIYITSTTSETPSNIVDGCIIEAGQLTGNNGGLTGVLVGGNDTFTMDGSKVRNCIFRNLNNADFLYNHGVTCADISDCLFDNCQVGVYYEQNNISQNTRLVQVNNCQFRRYHNGVQAVGNLGGGSYTVRGCHFEVDNAGLTALANLAVSIAGTNGGTLDNVWATQNYLSFRDGQSRPAPAAATDPVGLIFSNINRLVISNNMFNMYENAAQGREITATAGIANRTVVENYRMSGTLLT